MDVNNVDPKKKTV